MINEIIIGVMALSLGIIITYFYMKTKIHFLIKKSNLESLNKSRAVLKGQINEQIAPLLEDFPYNYSEVRFMGKPVDFIVFKGLDEQNITEVVFLEVKTASSGLNKTERSLKNCITSKKVSFEEYKIK